MTNRLLPLLSLVLAVGLFFGYVSPVWNGKIASAKAAIADDNRALDSARRYVERQNQLAAERDAIDPAALARLEIFLPDSVDNVGIILDLNALGTRSGLALSSIDVANSSEQSGNPGSDVSPVIPSNPVGTVDLTLSATGTYSALQAFLEGVERSARLLDVQDVTVAGSNTGVYDYHLTLRLYWLR